MIKEFVNSLKRTPKGLFNPWFHQDKKNDASPEAPEIRRKQLETYLEERRNRAKYLFIAEALGYQGGHFTGIAMTSERILLGHQFEKYGIKPDHVFTSEIPERTSSEDVNKLGMSEPTATIMWGTLINLGIDPHEVVLWNSVPWHPYNPQKGMLSNRTPLAGEMQAGLKHLKQFLALYPEAEVLAVGRKCEQSLSELGVKHTGVRHPANGGAPKFRAQLADLTAR
ncbi:MAG: uracil-DNA glycosylase [Balneolaceae bacterium]|nr:uracil-DNA glycosylase [Balneolaceae bacterium]